MTCFQKTSVPILILIMLLVSHNAAFARQKEMLVRVSEIEIDANYLEEYKAILKEEAEASVRLEPGVISIFPMYQKENPTQVRILEIYASREAYEAHLKTPHFQKYKTTTLRMVKSPFFKDPKWVKDRADFIAKHGKILDNLDSQFVSPVDFSPLK